MRRTWLASAAVAAAAISVPVTVVIPAAQAATLNGHPKAVRAIKTTTKAPVTWHKVVAALARRLVGLPYVYGGTTTAGFDCSGLTQFVYLHAGHGKRIQRTAQEQFLQFRRISHASARPGDLVFFHDTSNPYSPVYHVGVYEGGDDMVAATTYGEGVQLQSFTWGGDTVTFGTITLSPGGATPRTPRLRYRATLATALLWSVMAAGVGGGDPRTPRLPPAFTNEWWVTAVIHHSFGSPGSGVGAIAAASGDGGGMLQGSCGTGANRWNLLRLPDRGPPGPS